MKKSRRHITIRCLLAVWILTTGCDIDGPLEECDYNVRFTFRYTTGREMNEIGDYVNCATDYLFDSDNRLIEVKSFGKEGVGTRSFNLPEGRYTLVRWGNQSATSLLQPPVTTATDSTAVSDNRLSDCHLRQNNPSTGQEAGGAEANGDPLHYSCVRFEVPPVGIIRCNVYQAHAYLRLNVTVAGVEAPEGTLYTFELEGSHREMSFLPGTAICAHADSILFPATRETVDEVTHRVENCPMRSNGEINGEFITSRLFNTDRPVFRLTDANGQIIIGDIDLQKFFHTMQTDFDTNECQEFHLRITLGEDGQVYIQFVTLGDWIDGGSFG